MKNTNCSDGDIRPPGGGAQPYKNAVGHLRDMLHVLNLRIRREVMLQRRRRTRGEGWTGFVAVSDDEVDSHLSSWEKGGDPAEDSPVETSMENRLAALSEAIEAKAASSFHAGISLPAVELARTFGLSREDVISLVACLGPEVDRRYERLYGYLHDDMSRRRASVGLLLALRDGGSDAVEKRRAFSAASPLVRYQLLRFVDDAPGGNPFMSRTVEIDGRIAAFLLGEREFDGKIRNAVELADHGGQPAASSSRTATAERLAEAVNGCLRDGRLARKPVFYLHGRAGTGKRSLALEVCGCLHIPLLVIDAEQVAAGPAGFDDGMFMALRETLLLQCAAYIHNLDRVLDQNSGRLRLKSLFQFVRELSGITFLAGEQPWMWGAPQGDVLFLPVEIRLPDYAEQTMLWKETLGRGGALSDREVGLLVSKYPSSPGQIEEAVKAARIHASLRGEGPVTCDDVERGCRAQRSPDLGPLAKKIAPSNSWYDIVLPAAQLDQLREICTHVLHRATVYGAWGFGRKLSLGKGLNALFSGPPGTGKTMAAEVIASELGLDLYKIDLSQVVSKYIGETEKNLHQIFREAQASHAILFFDEADALLGKRSDVKDAHDRYANLEIAYLLQKMEEYEGITVLATNLRQNMDEAFTRRIRFIIEFPFPEEDYRLRIWRGIWPKETPLSEDVDLALMAKRFKLAGGNIRNIALTAAFAASANGGNVGMKHLLDATKREFLKMGRLVDEREYAR